jgi:hypothetical protein
MCYAIDKKARYNREKILNDSLAVSADSPSYCFPDKAKYLPFCS